MTYDEHLLLIAAEECNEIGQRLSKAIRFTLGEVQPGQSMSNAERIAGELIDLMAMVELLCEHGLLDATALQDRVLLDAKKAKVEKFAALSESLGALIPRDLAARAAWHKQQWAECCWKIGSAP